jgi:HlyD family secretion protein
MDEVEGVFIIRDRRVSFVRVDTGIAGERYFEVLSGLNSGDLVVTGPFDVVRTLQDGDAVQVNERSSRR